jgi:hypothetical protein
VEFGSRDMEAVSTASGPDMLRGEECVGGMAGLPAVRGGVPFVVCERTLMSSSEPRSSLGSSGAVCRCVSTEIFLVLRLCSRGDVGDEERCVGKSCLCDPARRAGFTPGTAQACFGELA